MSLFRSILLSCCLVLVSCSDNSDENGDNNTEYAYKTPVETSDGWPVESLDNKGLKSDRLTTLVNNIRTEQHGFKHIDSVLVAYQGSLVLHEEFKRELDFTDSWAANNDLNLHILNSVTKSVVSALIGIAIDKGVISGVEVGAYDYFAHRQPIPEFNEQKAATTLEDWLTMQHGYKWDEWSTSYFSPANDNFQMNNQNDPISFLFQKEMEAAPGTKFVYSTGISFALGRLLQNATGASVTEFMEQNLFDPLEIQSYAFWQLDGQLHTGSALYLSTRDLAKFGQLFLNKGVWNGQQVISQHWVETSTAQHLDLNGYGYGYQWWQNTHSVLGQEINSYSAQGLGGQYVFIFPEQDLVVAFMGSAYEEEETAAHDIWMVLADYILPTFL